MIHTALLVSGEHIVYSDLYTYSYFDYICQYCIFMSQLGRRIKTLRESKGITLADASKSIGCDSGLLSKMERGQRAIPKSTIENLSKFYKVEMEELNTLWLSDRIYSFVKDEPAAKEALALAERQVEYILSKKSKFFLGEILDKKISLKGPGSR